MSFESRARIVRVRNDEKPNRGLSSILRTDQNNPHQFSRREINSPLYGERSFFGRLYEQLLALSFNTKPKDRDGVENDAKLALQGLVDEARERTK